MLNKKNGDRIVYLDIYRGIGIIFMIMGHIWFGSYFDKFIHAFHMPMFFFISCFFYRKSKLGEVTKSKFKSLLIPYVIWGVFNVFLASMIDGVFYKNAIVHLLWINTDGLMDIGAIWFLTALFFSNVIYSIINYLSKEVWKLNIVIFLTSFTGIFLAKYSPVRLPWALDVALVGVGFMHIGRLVYERKSKYFVQRVMRLKWYEFLFISVVTTIMIFINGYINLRTGEYSCICLFWINALLSILILFNFSKRLCEFSISNVIINHIKEIVSYIGRYSITFLCLNQITIKIVVHFFDFLPILLSKIFILITTIIILCIVNYFINLTKFRVVIGIQKK